MNHKAKIIPLVNVPGILNVYGPSEGDYDIENMPTEHLRVLLRSKDLQIENYKTLYETSQHIGQTNIKLAESSERISKLITDIMCKMYGE